tara:strand:- start:3 stop:362 length:360 start_codon:yes stop_codon:yes gene_type:complete
MSGIVNKGLSKSGAVGGKYFVKAWCVVTTNSTIERGDGFTSGTSAFTDNGAGDFTVTLSRAMQNSNFYANAMNMHTLNDTDYDTRVACDKTYVRVYTYHSGSPANRFDSAITPVMVIGE